MPYFQAVLPTHYLLIFTDTLKENSRVGVHIYLPTLNLVLGALDSVEKHWSDKE